MEDRLAKLRLEQFMEKTQSRISASTELQNKVVQFISNYSYWPELRKLGILQDMEFLSGLLSRRSRILFAPPGHQINMEEANSYLRATVNAVMRMREKYAKIVAMYLSLIHI